MKLRTAVPGAGPARPRPGRGWPIAERANSWPRGARLVRLIDMIGRSTARRD